MKIAAKEAEETEYWLQLCKESTKYPFEPELESTIQSIIKLLGKILGTLKGHH